MAERTSIINYTYVHMLVVVNDGDSHVAHTRL